MLPTISPAAEKVKKNKPGLRFFKNVLIPLRKIRSIKHGINVFNCTHTVDGFEMTVDQMLVYIPQLMARKKKLERMAAHGQKERLTTSTRSNIIEYEYANYDVNQVQTELQQTAGEIMRAQLALEQANSTLFFEIEL